jgi:uncharacterized membrane protein YkvA (DUF1232 family)
MPLEQLLHQAWREWLLLLHIVSSLLCRWYGFEISLSSVVWVLVAVVYLVSPLDFIPDVIPVLGLADDVAIIAFAFSMIGVSYAFVRSYILTRERVAESHRGSEERKEAKDTPKKKIGDFEVDFIDEDDEEDCGICLDLKKMTTLVPCGHRLCESCGMKMKEYRLVCPFCSKVIQHFVEKEKLE